MGGGVLAERVFATCFRNEIAHSQLPTHLPISNPIIETHTLLTLQLTAPLAQELKCCAVSSFVDIRIQVLYLFYLLFIIYFLIFIYFFKDLALAVKFLSFFHTYIHKVR